MYLKQKIGKEGEEIATNYLIKENYKIIQRNFKSKQGEIDIIAQDTITNELVFIEVKTRTNYSYGTPAEAVNSIKQKHIYNTAKYYIYCKKMENIPMRIDAIEVKWCKNKYYINHIKQAINEKYF